MNPLDHTAAGFRVLEGTVRELLIPFVFLLLAIHATPLQPTQLLDLGFLIGLFPYMIHWMMRKPERYIEEVVRYREHRRNLLTYEE